MRVERRLRRRGSIHGLARVGERYKESIALRIDNHATVR